MPRYTRCQSKTKDGKMCKNKTSAGQKHCSVHQVFIKKPNTFSSALSQIQKPNTVSSALSQTKRQIKFRSNKGKTHALIRNPTICFRKKSKLKTGTRGKPYKIRKSSASGKTYRHYCTKYFIE